MKRIHVLSLVLLGSVLFPMAAMADTKLAYVDLQRAMEETDDGKKAKAKLKSEFDRKQQELNDKQDELKKMKDDLDKKSQLMKPEALAAEQQQFQQRVAQLQETFARLQRDLQQKQQDITQQMFGKLSTLVARIADRDHLSMVLEKGASVVWGQPSLDITNEVIRMYNAESAKK